MSETTVEQQAAEIERLRGSIVLQEELIRHGEREIACLRAEVEAWVNHAKTAIWSDSEECKMLEAENGKLRAALQTISDMTDYGTETASWRMTGVIHNANVIARAEGGSMIRADQIPLEVVKAAYAVYRGTHTSPGPDPMKLVIAAALAAWPGAFPHTFRGPLEGYGYVLPLPQESSE